MPRTATITAPDGRRATLTIPDGATDEQIAAATRSVAASLAGGPPASVDQTPQPSLPTTTPTSDTPGAVVPTTPDPSLAQVALYRGFIRPGADVLTAVGAYAPEEAEAVVRNLPGGAHYEAPRTAVERVLAPLSLAEPYAPVLFGLGVGSQYIFNDERAADALEGVAGLGSLARSVKRFLAARRVPVVAGQPRPEFRGRTPAEVAYLDQQQRVAAATQAEQQGRTLHAAAVQQAETTTAALDAERELAAAEYAARQRFAQAATEAEEAAVAHHVAAQNRLAAVRADLQAAIDARKAPEREVRAALGLPETTPTPEEAGRMLQAVGEQRTTLLPGAEVGVASTQFRLAQRTRELYARANALADAAGVTLPAQSAGASAIRDALTTWTQRTLKLGASPVEHETVAELVDLIKDGDVPYSVLNDFHARLSNLALDPREYPTATKLAQREFYRLKNTVESTLRSLEVATPELADAARAARQHVRDVEQPFKQTARVALRKGTTPPKAFEATVGSLDDPTHLQRIFQHAGAAEQDAYRMAFWTRELEHATDATGVTNLDTLLTRWNTLHPTARMLLASGATQEAQTAMLRIAAGKETIAQNRRVLQAAQRDVSLALAALRKSQAEARKAAQRAGIPFEHYDNVRAAAQAAKAAERDVARSAKAVERFQATTAREQRTLQTLGAKSRGGYDVPPGSRRSVIYHGAQAIRGLHGGDLKTAGIHAMTAYLVMRRPRLVAEAVKTPVDSPRGQQLAAALNAAVRGYRGFVAADSASASGLPGEPVNEAAQ